MPQELGWPVQLGASPPPVEAAANVENFLVSLVEPQCGHFVPFHSEERTSSSLSFSQAPQ